MKNACRFKLFSEHENLQFSLELYAVQVEVLLLRLVRSVRDEDLGLGEVREVEDGLAGQGEHLPDGAGVQFYLKFDVSVFVKKKAKNCFCTRFVMSASNVSKDFAFLWLMRTLRALRGR